MSESFEQQVATALGEIPRACNDRFGSCGISNHSPQCEADYRQRIAQRVTAAITAAGRVAIRSAEDGDRARANALAALRAAAS